MKFLKKAAALFFCLALALSVMAVTALAGNEPAFTIELVEATPHSDANHNDYNEYALDTSSVSYKIMLSGDTATVDAVQFTVSFSNVTGETSILSNAVVSANTEEDSSATVDSAGSPNFAIIDSTNSGFSISATATQIGTLTVNVSGNSGDKQSVSLTNVTVKSIDAGERSVPTATSVTGTIELDPTYNLTIKNPKADAQTGVVAAANGYDDSPYTYRILGGLQGGPIAASSRDYYEFTNYTQYDGTSNSVFTSADLASLSALTTAVGDSAHYGDVTLVANYKTEKFAITVMKPDGSTDNREIIDTTKDYVSGGATYYYDVEGNVYTDVTGATTATLLEVTINYYDFQNFTAVAASGTNNWNGETIAKNASSLDAGKHGDVTFNANYLPTEYTITLTKPDVDNNGVAKTGADEVVAADTSSVTYTIEGKKAQSGENALENASIPAASITAYDFQNYEIVSSDNSWTGTISAGEIGAGKHGAVTLKAVFSPVTYTVTYDMDNGNFTGTDAEAPTGGTFNDSESPLTFTYTIENTDDAGFTFGTPVRAHYTFDGWTVAKTNVEDTQPVHATFTGMTTATPTIVPAGLYGNVTLTAHWTATGAYAAKSYAFAEGTDKLVLFAVQEAVTGGGFTYNGDAMFIVDGKYAAAFDATYGVDSTWKIYGYIAQDATISAVQFDANTTNQSVSPATDMTGNGFTDSGDYGNVIAMLANHAYSYDVVSKEARLKADVYAPTDGMSSEIDAQFGTIADVRTIMNTALGGTRSMS